MRFDGAELDRCPMRPFLEDTEGINAVMERYNWARRGELPESGTWLDQPNVLLELFAVIDGAMADAEREKEERQRRQDEVMARMGGVGQGAKKVRPRKAGIRRGRRR